MKQNYIWNFFLWLSATDGELYKRCRNTAKGTRIAYSIFVLVTGILAFFTGGFFVRTFFSVYDEQLKCTTVSDSGWFISIVNAVIWMALIVTLDRMIIASRNRWVALLRLPLAIAIGFVVATPLEVQFFSSEIEKGLVLSSLADNKGYQNKLDTTLANSNAAIKAARSDVSNERSEASKWRDAMQAEEVGRIANGRTGKAGRGTAYSEAKENFDLHTQFLKEAQSRLSTLEANAATVEKNAKEEFTSAQIKQAWGFPSRYQQLCYLCLHDKDYNALKIGISLLLILIELIPSLIKLLSDKDSYDNLCEAQRNIDEQSINVLTNYYLDEIEKQGANILSSPHNQNTPKLALPSIYNTLT